MVMMYERNCASLVSLQTEQASLEREIDRLSATSHLPLLSVARLKRRLKDVKRQIMKIEGTFFPDTIA